MSISGRLKQGKATGYLVALGDRVSITLFADGSGVIEDVEKRKQAIVRLDPRPQGEYQQVWAMIASCWPQRQFIQANCPPLHVFVSAWDIPVFSRRLGMIDGPYGAQLMAGHWCGWQ